MSEPVTVYLIQRRCACGAEWLGRAFTPMAEGETEPRPGTCATCVAKADARLATLTHPIVETPIKDMTLTPPREVGDYE